MGYTTRALKVGGSIVQEVKMGTKDGGVIASVSGSIIFIVVEGCRKNSKLDSIW